MTKREMYEALLGLSEVAGNEELVGMIGHEIELLNRKNTGSKRPSKVTAEIKEAVLDALTDEPKAIKDVIAESFPDSGYTSQKLVPVMKALVADGLVERVTEKRVAKFKRIG